MSHQLLIALSIPFMTIALVTTALVIIQVFRHQHTYLYAGRRWLDCGLWEKSWKCLDCPHVEKELVRPRHYGTRRIG